MKSDAINSEKLIVINQSASKNKINFKNKKKLITFVGKLNRSKGYDLFGQAVIRILKKYKDWNAYVIGDEPRDKLNFKHNRLKNFGFKEHKEVIDIYKKTSIGSSINPLKIIIKVVVILAIIFGILVLISKINFPSPNQLIEKIIESIALQKNLYQ